MPIIEERKHLAATWFKELRDDICAEFESIETDYKGKGTAGKFEQKTWQRPEAQGESGGGGVMSIMRGRVFEKVGVNISVVHGQFSEEFRHKIPGAQEDPRFYATGISLVAHLCNPMVPAVHMNTRFISTSKSWFGGGADLTPTFPFEEDTADFHSGLKEACDRFDPTYYPRFKEWCDKYFFLPHRNESRGVGGIFYDYHDTGDWEKDFSLTKAVGMAFKNTYSQIARRRMQMSFTADDREKLLIKRGRYVEFNLLHDRGTEFGLKTGGNTEAILMSLPPEVKWP